MGPRFLFVCIGNICRSPMAEGIARAIIGNGVRAESAGIAAVPGNPPSEEAVRVIRAIHRTDISRHRARTLDGIRASDYDFIIALDCLVYNRIKDTGAVPAEKLFGWDIEDPIGLGQEAYERAARRIESRLRDFAAGHGIEI